MSNQELAPVGVLADPTWDIQDSTKINTYLDCPRKYFFEYVLGWRPSGTNIHLIFGDALHQAFEHLELNRKHWRDEDMRAVIVQQAYEIFYARFREEITQEAELELGKNKTCSSAALAISEYPKQFANEQCEVLYTEVGGVVYVTETDMIHYRIDLLARNETGKIFVRDHKTVGSANRQWLDSWSLSFQLGTYIHVLFSNYDPDEVWGAEINGIELKNLVKTGDQVAFWRVPVRKSHNDMLGWLWHARRYLSDIRREFEALSKATPDQPVMEAFPQNPGACTKYFGCPFAPYCHARPNPLVAPEPPLGFELFRWNPAEREAKKILNA